MYSILIIIILFIYFDSIFIFVINTYFTIGIIGNIFSILFPVFIFCAKSYFTIRIISDAFSILFAIFEFFYITYFSIRKIASNFFFYLSIMIICDYVGVVSLNIANMSLNSMKLIFHKLSVSKIFFAN